MPRLNRAILTLSGAHFLVDSYASMLGAFLPFLQSSHHLSLARAGLLVGALVVASALMQPVYGYLADRFQHKIFVCLGPGMAGLFIASLGLAPDFSALIVLLILGGMGIGVFHPQAASLASQSIPGPRTFPMAVFITGGMIGYALGPTLITLLILSFGLQQSYWAALPGVGMTVLLLRHGPSPQRRVTGSRLDFLRLLRHRWKPLAILYFLVVFRSTIQMVIVSFVPLFFTSQGHSPLYGSQILTLFLLAGGGAGLLGGILADRYGAKPVIALSMAGCLPLLWGFVWTDGWISIAMGFLGVGLLLLTGPVNVAVAQHMIPTASSTVSALMMGFAWGVGGVFVPLVGALSDAWGFHVTFSAVIALAIPAVALSLLLPSSRDLVETVHLAPSLPLRDPAA